MSTSQDHSSLSFRQRARQADVERQGLALGAERERARCAASVSQDRERQLEGAIDDWENEGGTAFGMPPSRPRLLRKLTTLQLSADLFRDDTLMRAVTLNGLLVLIAGGAVILWLNN
ncbi:hypothetical protein [Sphingobium sp. 15-1]|uniref:hypothetical protein n=2 Tax=Sphingobium TaxID=165695 RepID=UPI00159C596F|nr:hypothetical protein [Sphingobium sp. 15-1]